MKKLLLLILPVSFCMGVISCSSTKLNTARLVSAGTMAVTGLTISDAQVSQLSAQAVAQMDSQSRIAPANDPYTQRLNRLTANIKSVGSVPLNFKVYLTSDINAFATGDGSIRVYSGLMDVMDDAELIAIIGHEIGHVANTDARDAMRNTYLTYAARELVGATETTIGRLTDSQLGDVLLSFLDARYSRQQEYAADEYGFNFAIQHGYSPYAMANSLDKLLLASGGSESNYISNLFSSHPETQDRIKRMRDKADSYQK